MNRLDTIFGISFSVLVADALSEPFMMAENKKRLLNDEFNEWFRKKITVLGNELTVYEINKKGTIGDIGQVLFSVIRSEMTENPLGRFFHFELPTYNQISRQSKSCRFVPKEEIDLQNLGQNLRMKPDILAVIMGIPLLFDRYSDKEMLEYLYRRHYELVGTKRVDLFISNAILYFALKYLSEMDTLSYGFLFVELSKNKYYDQMEEFLLENLGRSSSSKIDLSRKWISYSRNVNNLLVKSFGGTDFDLTMTELRNLKLPERDEYNPILRVFTSLFIYSRYAANPSDAVVRCVDQTFDSLERQNLSIIVALACGVRNGDEWIPLNWRKVENLEYLSSLCNRIANFDKLNTNYQAINPQGGSSDLESVFGVLTEKKIESISDDGTVIKVIYNTSEGQDISVYKLKEN